MSNNDDVKCLCYSCIGDEFLSNEVRKTGKSRECSYCGKMKKTQPIEYIARRVETALKEHFRQTPDQPDDWEQTLLCDNESNYAWDRHGDPLIDVISMSVNVGSEIAEDIQSNLSNLYFDCEPDTETEFSANYKELEPSSVQLENDWHSLKKSLKYESRFFNRKNRDFFY